MPSASVVRFRHWLALYAALGRVRWHWAQGRGMVLYNIAMTNKYDKPINRQPDRATFAVSMEYKAGKQQAASLAT